MSAAHVIIMSYFQSISMFRMFLPLLTLAACVPVLADEPTFKSDVAMTRVDAQVVDRDGRAITGLERSDFVLRVDGKVVPIRNFASENMPIDILLLIDVSGSMEPHVQRIASAAREALNVLADKDRVAIMVFDTSTHVRLPFRSSHSEITSELNHLLRSEGFNGGTRITSALISAANYVGREARPDARRAIVILTDDETQDSEDEPRVESALARANAVLSFLQAPYETPQMGGGGGRRHGTWGSGGGGLARKWRRWWLAGRRWYRFSRRGAYSVAAVVVDMAATHRIQPELPPSRRIPAATPCRSKRPRRSKIRSPGCASAMRCISICQKGPQLPIMIQ